MLDDLDDLIACPQCDALWRAASPAPGQRARCGRCNQVLITPRIGAEARVVALALALMILTLGALSFPFLTISARGLSHSASLAGAAFAFAGGPYEILALAVLAAIVLIPVLRVLLIVYTLAPLALGRAPATAARAAFLWSERLRPWSMGEIFAIGCAVALVKVADLATIGFGPAFWMFGLVTIAAVLQDQLICRWSIWEALDRARPAS